MWWRQVQLWGTPLDLPQSVYSKADCCLVFAVVPVQAGLHLKLKAFFMISRWNSLCEVKVRCWSSQYFASVFWGVSHTELRCSPGIHTKSIQCYENGVSGNQNRTPNWCLRVRPPHPEHALAPSVMQPLKKHPKRSNAVKNSDKGLWSIPKTIWFGDKKYNLGKRIAQTRAVQERSIADSSADWKEAADGTGKRWISPQLERSNGNSSCREQGKRKVQIFSVSLKLTLGFL